LKLIDILKEDLKRERLIEEIREKLSKSGYLEDIYNEAHDQTVSKVMNGIELYKNILKERDEYKQKRKSLFEARQVEEILGDLNVNDAVYEITINTSDAYEYEKREVPGAEVYQFVDKNDIIRSVVFRNDNHEVKTGWKNKEEDQFRNDKPDSELADNKVLNTIAKIVLEDIIPEHDIIILKCVDELRFRFFRALIYKNLNEKQYNIATQGNDIIIQKEK